MPPALTIPFSRSRRSLLSKERFPDVKIGIVGRQLHHKLVGAAANIDVSAYVLKNDAMTEKIAFIAEIIASGGTYFSPGVWDVVKSKSPGGDRRSPQAHGARA